MATETIASPLGEMRASSTASGGTALTTTAAFVELPPGTSRVVLIPRNFSTAVVARYAINPYLAVLFTQDNLATATDGSEASQDGTTGTGLTLNSWDTAVNLDYLYVGAYVPFRGVRVIIGNTNGNASTLTVNFWNGSAWTDITATDGSASAGASFGQTGNVTWTVPTTWVRKTLGEIASPVPAAGIAMSNESLYWTRWQQSAALDATVSATSLLAMNRSTAYAEIPSGFSEEFRVRRGVGGVGCVEAVTDAGTANLIVNVSSALGNFQ